MYEEYDQISGLKWWRNICIRYNQELSKKNHSKSLDQKISTEVLKAVERNGLKLKEAAIKMTPIPILSKQEISLLKIKVPKSKDAISIIENDMDSPKKRVRSPRNNQDSCEKISKKAKMTYEID